jgi:hypothetical protein
MHPVDSPLQDWQKVVLTGEDEVAVGNGRSVALDDKYCAEAYHCRAYNGAGEFIAILRYSRDEGLWHPDKVFSS